MVPNNCSFLECRQWGTFATSLADGGRAFILDRLSWFGRLHRAGQDAFILWCQAKATGCQDVAAPQRIAEQSEFRSALNRSRCRPHRFEPRAMGFIAATS